MNFTANDLAFTTNDLAATLGVNRDTMYILVRFLEAQGIIICAGKQEPAEKKRGKRQYVYAISQDTLNAIKALLRTRT